MLLLPMVYGVDSVVRGYAERFAAEGFVTEIWDPYPGRPAREDETFDELIAREASLEDAVCQAQQRACLDRLAEQASYLAVAGWCMGGRQALLLAAADARVRTCLAFYPTIRRPAPPGHSQDALAAAAAMPAEVLLAKGGLDQVTPGDVWPELEQALRSRSEASVLLHFPRADHGFMDTLRHASAANAAAADRAWAQAFAFVRTSATGAGT